MKRVILQPNYETEYRHILALALLGIQKIVSQMVMPLCQDNRTCIEYKETCRTCDRFFCLSTAFHLPSSNAIDILKEL